MGKERLHRKGRYCGNQMCCWGRAGKKAVEDMIRTTAKKSKQPKYSYDPDVEDAFLPGGYLHKAMHMIGLRTLPENLISRLKTVDELCQRGGGRLKSRQVIAAIVADMKAQGLI